MNETAQQILFAIKEIKEQEFFVNESLELGSAYDFNYRVDIATSIPNDTIAISITANYLVTQQQDVLMKGKTATTFLIQNLKQYSRKTDDREGVDLPDPLLITLFSISFSHARALLSKSSAGTKFSHMLMPLINPDTEFKKIFAQEFSK